ncbi:hypothetical protein [Chryseobacterium carnipullorum]|nr:hypothetical protein [Chryseobacterium carnipullorum]
MDPDSDIPYQLLLLADETIEAINQYILTPIFIFYPMLFRILL